MKLTTKGRYAVTAMLDIALHQDKGQVSLADIAGRQGISQSYLEQLSAKLRRADLLTSVRGSAGGYLLSRPAAKISVADIILATNESVDNTQCGGAENCHNGLPCLTHDLWADLNHTINDFLTEITLADLMKKPQVQKTARRQDHSMEMAKFPFITKKSYAAKEALR
ncbi:MAG: Rrf2 family transcriptional regulator [Pseudomonadota bacterium]